MRTGTVIAIDDGIVTGAAASGAGNGRRIRGSGTRTTLRHRHGTIEDGIMTIEGRAAMTIVEIESIDRMVEEDGRGIQQGTTGTMTPLDIRTKRP